ncbi:hypothetical protein [Aquabacterium sp. J223]|uniref:hypothetical protein n=1 Tax=Aquabacterium sp. J223 TaxID=2898431 RepID=UPI0021AD69CF|nr:hypothetical protein [Aquabacterium sp. J223]UUX95925.1 hypothetical protein LRS07_00810 [Aquabacterium sp. J223]
MSRLVLRPLLVVLLLGLSGAAARAESFVSSAASSASSASVGSLSDSLQGSSRSSTRDDKVAEGDYRVLAVQAEGERQRLTLEPAGAPGDGFELRLPRTLVEREGLAAGALLQVRRRPYGLQFARAEARQQPFFLALADDWLHGLAAVPVGR